MSGKTARTESGLHFAAFIMTVFGVAAMFALLRVPIKTDNRVLVGVSLVGLLLIAYQLRRLNLLGILAFEQRVDLALLQRYIAAGEDVEVLFRQRLRRSLAVSSISLTLYAELIDKSGDERTMAHIRKLSPERLTQEGKLIEAVFKIHIPKLLELPSEYEDLPVEWRLLGSIKLKMGPKSLSSFNLPVEG